MGYVLGIDLGTSSLKGILMNKTGEIVSTASSDYSVIHPKIGYAEQDPQDWINACDKVFCQLTEEVSDFPIKLQGISFSGQMHSLVMLDENYKVLHNAILWNDVRTTQECEEIMSEAKEEILTITKNIALEGFTLPKILWVQKHLPDIWEKVRHILLPKDYLRFILTGNLHMDYSDAAGTLLFDIKNHTWSDVILEKFNINRKLLPTPIESSGKTGSLNEDVKRKFGINHDVEVFAGGADNACAALGAGIINSTKGLASIGTSGVFLSFEEDPNIDYEGDVHFFNHVVTGCYYSMGVTLAAGNSLNWFRKTFAPDLSFDKLLANIKNVPVGSKGLLFAPYISGERTPYNDSVIRGSFIGMDASHNLDYFARAVLEGITYSLRDSKELMEKKSNKRFKTIVSVGGGAQNKNWIDMQSDIFDSNVTTLKSEQGPGVGAAMLAAKGLAWFDTWDELVECFISTDDIHYQSKENVSEYNKYYKAYQMVYPQTRPINKFISTIVRDN